MAEGRGRGAVTERIADDDDFEDVERELCSSAREVSVGFDPGPDLEAFRAAIRSSHWRVDHRRLW